MNLGSMIQAGYVNSEISEMLKRPLSGVAIKSQRIWNGNPNYRKRITKHKHLHREALLTYKYSSFEKAAEKLNLTHSEMKSCLSSAYREKSLAHIRKDKRRKDKWTEKQIKQMLQMIGLRPRGEIARKIGRGSSRVVKEKLQNIGIKAPKYLNGLTKSRYVKLFKKNPQFYLETDAGPGRGMYSQCYFKIVPWVYIKDQIESGELNPPMAIVEWVNSMSSFQEWIHDGDAYGSLLNIQEESL